MVSMGRIVEFDILKGIGILLVVLGHTGISGLPYTYIYAFHMPLFFIVSGFFYKPQGIKQLVKKRTKQLLVPWLFFVCLFSIYEIVRSFIESGDFLSALQGYFQSFNIFDEKCWFLYSSIWFLICLFGVSIIYALIDKYISLIKYLGGGIILVFYLIAWTLSHYRINVPFYIDSMMGCLIYYHIGYLFKMLNFWQHNYSIMKTVSVLLFLSVLIVYLRPEVGINRNDFPLYLPLISVPFVVALYFLVKALVHRISHNFFLIFATIGTDTLLILGFQCLFLKVVENINFGLSGLLLCIARFIIVMLAILAIRWPVVKYIPECVGKIRKNE